ETNYLIVIAGPTGVGKTNVAITLAEWLDTEIISADSRQIYQELNIGTAKPGKNELNRVRHHFIHEISIEESFTAADFERQSLERLATIFALRKFAIVAGGTGLYIDALCKGLDEIPTVDPKILERLEALMAAEGLERLKAMLIARDPVYAKSVDMHNPRRIIRALSVIEETGTPFSSFLRKSDRVRPFEIIKILLEEERETLYARIDQRVEDMLEAGLENEVRSLEKFGSIPAMQTVGYQEWVPYFKGDISRGEAIRLIKRNSRRYAKRQMTWFRRDQDCRGYKSDDIKSIKAYIAKITKSLL
ncbi:UNVERIFIED_CONTAM: hypothetical protein GTU68_048571, partial [Idotea baltica]|nr:hypothetical protein [Idotea baltica]